MLLENIKVKTKLVILTLIGILTTSIVGGIAIWSNQSTNIENTILYSEALRDQMEADMMHDALRADVLNALRVGNGGSQSEKDAVTAGLNEHIERFQKHFSQLQAMNLGPELETTLGNAQKGLEAYVKSAKEITLLALQDPFAANERLPEFFKAYSSLEESMQIASGSIEKHMDETITTAREFANTSFNYIIVIFVIGVLIQTAFSWIVISNIAGNLAGVVAVINTFAKGKLNVDLFKNEDDDEISHLFSTLHDLQEKLVEVIGGIRVGASEVTVVSDEVAQGNANLSQRTQEQASSLEEVASSMEEMTSTVSQNAENSQVANQLAQAAKNQAEKGGSVVDNAITAMNEITISSKKISDIIGVIDEIAFQTNLLALNAAVEAARAGEMGRGFAVVASEVRSLAGRSATAAKEIKGLISDSVTKVELGAKLVNESGAMLTEILNSVAKVTDVVAEITAASQEQSSGIAQVNKAVMQMDEMTQQNASLVEQAAAAAESMGAQAQELNSLVAYFNLGKHAVAIKHEKREAKPARVQHQKQKEVPALTATDKQHKTELLETQKEDDGDWEEF